MKILHREYPLLVLAVLLVFLHPGCDRPSLEVTLGTLLVEMTDREVMARFAEEGADLPARDE